MKSEGHMSTTRRTARWAARILAFIMAPVLASAPMPDEAKAAASDRPVGNRALLGVGGTWTGPEWYQRSVHPGAMIGFDLGLGRHASIGLLGDITSIDDPRFGQRYHLVTGLDVKLLPIPRGIVRPWVSAGAALSLLNDSGLGLGVGAGAFFLPDTPMAFFVDVRRYHFVDMENPQYRQVMLRAGVAF
jgi:hypothetical protein